MTRPFLPGWDLAAPVSLFILSDCLVPKLSGERARGSASPRCDRSRPSWSVRLETEVLPVVKLRVRSGESIQEAVRRFRKLCERSGLRKEMRRKAYYEKPSERRRREELKRLRKARQAARV
jgi:small subunit ribosomal protein S21